MNMPSNDSWLRRIPALLSSKLSIFIYLFLFFYLVIFPIVCFLIPALAAYIPSDMVQLVLGNYTNVLSALGASIAAGTGAAVHSGFKHIHQRHDLLEKTLHELNHKVSELKSQG